MSTNQKYQCSICERYFSQSVNLLQHFWCQKKEKKKRKKKLKLRFTHHNDPYKTTYIDCYPNKYLENYFNIYDNLS